ncbi:MAG: L,D-transpeptidase, partial [Verrucomicrobiota bacterium]
TSLLEKAAKLGFKTTYDLLSVDGAGQRMHLIRDGNVRRTWTVSTARAGFGNRDMSFKTPTGFHRVEDRIGAGAPLGRVFISREPTDRIWSPGDTDMDDLILTRILRLRGLEPNSNLGNGTDSYRRYIYIHGTNHEDQLGQPVSQGCIRMSNLDVVECFDEIVDRTCWCWIGAPDA